jgi:HEPN domain-containing protein
VDEPHTSKGYRSDFDILVIVNQKELTDRDAYWSKADERLTREYLITKTLHTPANPIIHSLQQVNDGLAHGRYFFMDIVKDGIALYESDSTELHKPKPKTPEQALAMAKEYFDEWLPSGVEFYDNFKFNLELRRKNNAAFQLHQAAERLYHCVNLVCTFYTPHNHNLTFLRTQAERLDYRLRDVWSSANRKERAMFEKLRDAYVKARYSKHYHISEEELTWLGARVEELCRIVHLVCSEKIAEFETVARLAGAS